MKANIAKKVLLCTLTAALLVAPATGVLAAGSGAGTKAVGGGDSGSSKSKVEEIIDSNSSAQVDRAAFPAVRLLLWHPFRRQAQWLALSRLWQAFILHPT